jgi:hypothetical protein
MQLRVLTAEYAEVRKAIFMICYGRIELCGPCALCGEYTQLGFRAGSISSTSWDGLLFVIQRDREKIAVK